MPGRHKSITLYITDAVSGLFAREFVLETDFRLQGGGRAAHQSVAPPSATSTAPVT